MTQRGANSFLKFTLGFTVFIALSFGLTYAVSTYSIAKEREELFLPDRPEPHPLFVVEPGPIAAWERP